MAIATAGIIDQEWADLLKSWIAGDRYVDYYIETANNGINLPVDTEDQQTIRSYYSLIDSITGLRIRETADPASADIYIAQVDRSFFGGDVDGEVLGVTSVENDGELDYFMLLYSDREYDHTTIMHEMGHTVGLAHPYGDGFNPLYTRADTIMSYNRSTTGKVNFTDSDRAALKYLWGEAGTNYDAAAPVTTPGPVTPQPPTTPNDALVTSLVSGAWFQPSEVSWDSSVTYYIDKKFKYRFTKGIAGRKGYSGGVSAAEATFIRDLFSQVDSAIPRTISEVGSARQADIVIGSVMGNKQLGAEAVLLTNGRVETGWSDEKGKKLTILEKIEIGLCIGQSFGLSYTPGYPAFESIVGDTSSINYGLTVNDRTALAQIWAV